jgi:hypothetical protein
MTRRCPDAGERPAPEHATLSRKSKATFRTGPTLVRKLLDGQIASRCSQWQPPPHARIQLVDGKDGGSLRHPLPLVAHSDHGFVVLPFLRIGGADSFRFGWFAYGYNWFLS